MPRLSIHTAGHVYSHYDPRNILSANWQVHKLSCPQTVISANSLVREYLRIGMSAKRPVTQELRLGLSLEFIRLLSCV